MQGQGAGVLAAVLHQQQPQGRSHGDAKAFDDEPLNEDQQEQRHRNPVVRNGVKATGLHDAAVPQRHQETDDADDPEQITEERVIEIEGVGGMNVILE